MYLFIDASCCVGDGALVVRDGGQPAVAARLHQLRHRLAQLHRRHADPTRHICYKHCHKQCWNTSVPEIS